MSASKSTGERKPLLDEAREAPADGGVREVSAGDDKASPGGREVSAGDDKASHTASLRAGAMLGQMCERSLIEHQLASCYFAVRNFCEHAPAR